MYAYPAVEATTTADDVWVALVLEPKIAEAVEVVVFNPTDWNRFRNNLLEKSFKFTRMRNDNFIVK